MNLNLKWTPGPWTYRQLKRSIQISGYGKNVATIALSAHLDNADNEANAAIIAAAPDLYDALVDMVQTYWEDAKDYEPPPSMVQKAKRALAKARGDA